MEQQLQLMVDILSGIIEESWKEWRDDERICRYCHRREQYFGYGITHQDTCPVTLMRQLKGLRAE